MAIRYQELFISFEIYASRAYRCEEEEEEESSRSKLAIKFRPADRTYAARTNIYVTEINSNCLRVYYIGIIGRHVYYIRTCASMHLCVSIEEIILSKGEIKVCAPWGRKTLDEN